MEPVPTDFWGIVVPTWVGAFGSVMASAVAVIAYVNSRSAKSGVREIGDSLNQVPNVTRTAVGTLNVEGSATATVGPPRVWEFEHQDSMATFRNVSGRLLTVTNISGSRGLDLTLRNEMPLLVPPTAKFRARVHRILGGPAVTGVSIEWMDGAGSDDGERFTETFFV